MRALYASAAIAAIDAMPPLPILDAPSPGYTPPTTGANRRAGKTYTPNGKREVARRLRQAERIAAKRAST